LLELPVPPAETVIVKVAVPPATTGPFPDFAMDTSGWQFTVTDAVAAPPPSLVVAAVAWFDTVPHVAAVVGLVR